jgi:hypothetical protein
MYNTTTIMATETVGIVGLAGPGGPGGDPHRLTPPTRASACTTGSLCLCLSCCSLSVLNDPLQNPKSYSGALSLRSLKGYRKRG